MALPDGSGVGLLQRCRMYDDKGRLYSLQYACLLKLMQLPQRQQSDAAALAAAWTQPPLPPRDEPPWQQRQWQPGLHADRQLAPAGEAEAAPSGEQQQQQQQRQQPGLQWAGFVSMPGGGNKFTVRFDSGTGHYMALTNPSIDRYGGNADARNILVLVSCRHRPPSYASQRLQV